jgi:hypothetical protein
VRRAKVMSRVESREASRVVDDRRSTIGQEEGGGASVE